MKNTDGITTQTIFDAQRSDCPAEVKEDARRMWVNNDLHNDVCYVQWDPEEGPVEYPAMAKYLTSKGVEKCLVHWWW